jgi:2-methylcitrate dehydratase
MIEHLACWVLAPRAQDIPDAAVEQAKLLMLDTIGCGYAALDEESACAVLATLADLGGAPHCSVIGAAPKTSAPNAVLVNGALIRILDLNDYVNNRKGEIGGHPSDNIPVALAAGEMCGASGHELIAAIVLGYEIFGRGKEMIERDSGWDGVTVSGLVAPAMA